MSSEIDIQPGKYGNRAILKSKWSENLARVVNKHHCQELEINTGNGWSGEDLSFLSAYPWLKSLKIIDYSIKSVTPVHDLHELRELEILTYCKSELRFDSFPHLEKCALEWRPKADSVFNKIKLNYLFLNRYSGKDLQALSNLKKLESLAILNAPITSLDGIENLVNLRTIRLANLRNLGSLKGIEELMNLEELDIHTCKNISKIDEISGLSKLRTLFLNNDGEIASLSPIEKLQNIESVVFYESTNILDGDLSALKHLQKLSKVSFQNRRHYTHKKEDFL